MNQDTERRMRELLDQEYFESGNQTQYSPEQLNLNEIFLDPTYIIDELINTLRGRIIDSVSQKIIELDAAVEEKAISFLVSRILPYTSKLFTLSLLDEDKIREMVYEFESNLAGDLLYCEQYGIRRKDRDFIHTLTVQTMEVTIRRAKDGTTMKRMLSQHQIKEITSRMEGNEKKSGGFNIRERLKI